MLVKFKDYMILRHLFSDHYRRPRVYTDLLVCVKCSAWYTTHRQNEQQLSGIYAKTSY